MAIPLLPPSQRYPYLDGWRGICILAVLVAHFLTLPWINTGRLGVEMFFVLSGRLMAEILFVKEMPLSTFFLRRISRVWPALFTLVVLLFLAGTLVTPQWTVSFPALLSCLTFTYNYLHGIAGGGPVIDHIWSLCIEEHIYLLLGGLAFLTRKFKLPILATIAIFTLAFMINGLVETWAWGRDYYQVYWRTDTRGASILVSVLVFLAIRKWNISVRSWVPVALFTAGALLNFDRVSDGIKYTLGTTLVALSINLISFSPRWQLRLLSSPFIAVVGTVSFSLYLWQQPFYALKETYPIVLLLLGVVAMGIVSYFFVERPTRNYLNRLWKPKGRDVLSSTSP